MHYSPPAERAYCNIAIVLRKPAPWCGACDLGEELSPTHSTSLRNCFELETEAYVCEQLAVPVVCPQAEGES
jgi:hypothetical protein